MANFKLQTPDNREVNGGDLLAQALRHLGTEVAFGVHGGHLDAFLLGAEESGIKLIDTRHETTAVQAAEGYAKVFGKVGVCFVTANSGFANGLSGLMSAFADRSPVFCITSSPPLQDAETNALQGFHDQVVVAKPMTRFAHRVTNVEEIPRLVAYGFRAANTGIKGPVLLDFPIDVLFTPPQIHRVAYGALSRPLIITGTGALGIGKQLTKLAETTNTPVFYSNKFSSPLPPDHELRAGPATALAAFAGFLLAGRSGAIIPNTDRTLTQVDLDGSEIGKSHAVDIGIVADAALFIDAFLNQADSTTFQRNDGWVQKCSSIRTAASPFAKDPKVQKDGQLHPYHAVNAVMEAIPNDSIIIIDGSEAGQWAGMTAEHAQPHVAIVSSGYLGMLGNGWGYAMGAVVVDPSRLVVSIHGDGSTGFHIQELDTFARFNLRIMIVIANNHIWGMSVNGQDLLYDGITDKRPAVQLSKACRYDVIARGFNCAAEYITECDQIKPAVKKLAKGGGPSLINMIVSVKPTTPATNSMVGATKDPNVIVVPYYDNVPRPYYKDSVS